MSKNALRLSKQNLNKIHVFKSNCNLQSSVGRGVRASTSGAVDSGLIPSRVKQMSRIKQMTLNRGGGLNCNFFFRRQ